MVVADRKPYITLLLLRSWQKKKIFGTIMLNLAVITLLIKALLQQTQQLVYYDLPCGFRLIIHVK